MKTELMSNAELIELANKTAAADITSSGSDVRTKALLINALSQRLQEFENAPLTEGAKRVKKRRQSRADRFSEAQGDVSGAKSVMEELRDELQNWKDSLPENLQNGSKADELDSAISELDDIINNLEDVEGRDVSFPGMFG